MKHTLPISAALSLVLMSAASAATVGNTFTGVTTPGLLPEDLSAEFPTGTRWTMVVEWDSAATSEPSDTQASFPATKLTLTLQGKNGAWTTSAKPGKASFSLGTFGGVHSIQFTTSWGPDSVTNATIGSLAPYSINLTLEDPTQTAITSMTNAPAAIDLSKWVSDKNQFKMYLNNEGNRVMYGSVDLPSGKPDITVKQGKDLKDGKSTVSFGSVKVGKKGAAKTFTIGNSGKGTLKDIAVKVSGSGKDDFIVSSLGGKTLAKGKTTEFKVTFKPKKKGNRKAILTVISNDPDEGSFEIDLTGTGTKPKAAVAEFTAAAR